MLIYIHRDKGKARKHKNIASPRIEEANVEEQNKAAYPKSEHDAKITSNNHIRSKKMNEKIEPNFLALEDQQNNANEKGQVSCKGLLNHMTFTHNSGLKTIDSQKYIVLYILVCQILG